MAYTVHPRPLHHQLKSKYGQFFARKPQVLLHFSDTLDENTGDTTIALSAYCCWRYLLNTVSGSKHCHVVPNKVNKRLVPLLFNVVTCKNFVKH